MVVIGSVVVEVIIALVVVMRMEFRCLCRSSTNSGRSKSGNFSGGDDSGK